MLKIFLGYFFNGVRNESFPNLSVGSLGLRNMLMVTGVIVCKGNEKDFV